MSAETQASKASLPPVLLPRTAFPAHPRVGDAERATAERWLSCGLHDRAHAAVAGLPRFVLHDGPPYANGDVHMGHAVNKTLKDMVVRSQRMMGRDAVLVPGWDCHGLPVEWKVEERYRERGLQKRDVPVLEFRRACRDYAAAWVARQADGFRRLGVMADWGRPYLTMQPEAYAATVGELHKLLLGGRLYRALRPVLWSVPERTALADAEVEYAEERYTSLMVRFPVASAAHPALVGASLACWTTTPWSLPGNRAVACNPGARYGVWRVLAAGEGSRLRPGETLVLGMEVAEGVLAKSKATSWELLADLAGTDLAGTSCRHPLANLGYGHAVPVLPAAFVGTGTGTGLVHVAPGLGPDDFRLGLAHGLPVLETVGEDGRYVASVPHFAGATVVGDDGRRGDADDRVMAALEEAGAVVSSWRARHEVGFSWRSKAPLVYRATPQWFVSVEGLREEALSALAGVEFLPAESRSRLEAMLAQRPDWCVSRQRAWGVPLGLFVRRGTGEPLADPAVLARVRQAFAEEGGDAWYSRPASWFLGDAHDPADWEQVMDVLDVWFESGCTHAWVVAGRHGEGAVADLCLEGTDQHRGWFQSSLLEAVATRGQAPYKALVTHGFVLDQNGRKMSKSLGNVVDPMEAADRLGADALRLWVAAADTSADMRYAEKGMAAHREALRRYRNTLRWALGNLAASPFDPLPAAAMEEPERWVLARLNEVGRALREAAARHDMAACHGRLLSFCADDLSAFWFNMRKDALYCDPAGSLRRRGVATALSAVFDHLCLWLAPLAPFAADEAWSERHGREAPGVHERRWPEPTPGWDDPALLARWDAVRRVRDAVLAALEPEQRSGRLKALLDAAVELRLPSALREAVAGVDLAMVCGVSALRVDPRPSAEVVVDGRPAAGSKCARCWQVLPEVAADADSLCSRCAGA